MDNTTISNITTIVENTIPAANSAANQVSNMIDPFWFYSCIGVLILSFIVVVLFFLGSTFILRIKMLGRQGKGYGVIELIHRNGRRTSHPVKFEREITIGDYLFKPKYDQEHLFRNEYGMPTVTFNVRSIENIPIVNNVKMEVDESLQVKANKPPLVMTDPAEDLQSHMAFFQAGMLFGGTISQKLQTLIFIAIIISAIGLGICAFGFYKLGVFA